MDRGKIEVDYDISSWLRILMAGGNVELVPLSPAAAIASARLRGFHLDLADRFLYATAREFGVGFVTKDGRIREYASRSGDVEVIW